MKPDIVRTLGELREEVAGWKRRGETVGVVPTMGALHEGHMSLVRRAVEDCDRVIVTLFVNPKQFNDKKDLEAYPRTENEDRGLLEPLQPDILYVPDGDQMYPEGFATNVSVSRVSEGLCGDFRPGHFDGVATIVAKLFLQTAADKAFFGEKDYQQLQVVRRMARDLDIPIEVVGCPTIREDDGLAMSSRNRRLSAEERAQASVLPQSLMKAADAIADGGDPAEAIDAASKKLIKAGFGPVEYLELRGADDLAPMTRLDRSARLLVGAWLGDVRLIDNVPVLPAG